MMKRIALTGGIACGKSLAAKYFVDAGVKVLDADDVVHEILPDPNERRRLAAEVFADPEKRQALEARIHPIVRARLDAFLSAPSGSSPRRIVSVPLLFETGWDRDFDIVICLASARETQIVRMMETRGYTRAEAEARLAAQWPIDQKRARADVVIDNDGTPDELCAKIKNLLPILFPSASDTVSRRVYGGHA